MKSERSRTLARRPKLHFSYVGFLFMTDWIYKPEGYTHGSCARKAGVFGEGLGTSHGNAMSAALKDALGVLHCRDRA